MTTPATPDEITTYYQNLLIAQYRGQPNARATVGLLAKEAIGDTLTLFPLVRDMWSLETAVGKQLDVIGSILGVKRYLYGTNTNKTYFGMPQLSIGIPDDPENFFGFIALADIPPGGLPTTAWYWFVYPDLYSYIGNLDDDTFRRLLKYLIISRSMECTIGNIDWLLTPTATRLAPDGTLKTVDQWFAPSISIWGAAVNPVVLTDAENMVITYTVSATKTGAGFDNTILISAIETLSAFPKPSGARVVVVD